MYLGTNETAPPYRPGVDRKSAYKNAWQKFSSPMSTVFRVERCGMISHNSSDASTSSEQVKRIVSHGPILKEPHFLDIYLINVLNNVFVHSMIARKAHDILWACNVKGLIHQVV